MSRCIKRECPACKKIKNYRSDNITCGCMGTNIHTNLQLQGTNPKVVSEIKTTLTPQQIQEIELEKLRLKQEDKTAQVSYLQERVLELEREHAIFLDLKNSKPTPIDVPSKLHDGSSESAMVVVWSDWHIEERVLASQVSDKNEFNLEIAKKRFANLLDGTISWFNINRRDTKIQTVILALLGDFITGSIHEDLAEGNQLPPSEALYLAYSLLVSGIKYLLANTPEDVQFIIPCHSGNHGRMTKDQRIATESGNSLEYFMYLMLRDYFAEEKRIKFIIQPGYHSYVRLFEGTYEIRFHHGHQINYQGGVGGISIPVGKAIAQWNKAHTVNLDVFGHFHQRFDGGNFICNGSLIGYNAYAVSIKAGYEVPSQVCFLVNKEFENKTAVMPIFVD